MKLNEENLKWEAVSERILYFFSSETRFSQNCSTSLNLRLLCCQNSCRVYSQIMLNQLLSAEYDSSLSSVDICYTMYVIYINLGARLFIRNSTPMLTYFFSFQTNSLFIHLVCTKTV